MLTHTAHSGWVSLNGPEAATRRYDNGGESVLQCMRRKEIRADQDSVRAIAIHRCLQSL
jgi:hypothetical protein